MRSLFIDISKTTIFVVVVAVKGMNGVSSVTCSYVFIINL